MQRLLNLLESSASHLTRGAWIEMLNPIAKLNMMTCRTSHEVRGLKYNWGYAPYDKEHVAPHTRCVD